ncbi:hypothetical protein JKP88DRAFT_250186 [Tribonema minus]|uniref:Uncharacterized protein n=1 Tax=Tribonema minus TaxID=303371 RepID=A0A835YHS6_9STRA|nr:hypothetical protein JKP88DRAFT_250186 [Tribonema minus]
MLGFPGSQLINTEQLLGPGFHACDLALLLAEPGELNKYDIPAEHALGGARLWLLERCGRQLLQAPRNEETFERARPHVEEALRVLYEYARSEECRKLRQQVLDMRAQQSSNGGEVQLMEEQIATRHCISQCLAARAVAQRARSNGIGSAGTDRLPADLEQIADLRPLLNALQQHAKNFTNAKGGVVTGLVERRQPKGGRTTHRYTLSLGAKGTTTPFGPVFSTPAVPATMRDVLLYLQRCHDADATILDAAVDLLAVVNLLCTGADLHPAMTYPGRAWGGDTHADHHMRGMSLNLLEVMRDAAQARASSGGPPFFVTLSDLLRAIINIGERPENKMLREEVCREGAQSAAGLTLAKNASYDEIKFEFLAFMRQLTHFRLQRSDDVLASQIGHLPPSIKTSDTASGYCPQVRFFGERIFGSQCAAALALVSSTFHMVMSRGGATLYLHPTDWPRLHLIPLPHRLHLGDKKSHLCTYAADVLHFAVKKIAEKGGKKCEPAAAHIEAHFNPNSDAVRQERAWVQVDLAQARITNVLGKIRERRERSASAPQVRGAEQTAARKGPAAEAAAYQLMDAISAIYPGSATTDLPPCYFDAASPIDLDDVPLIINALRASMRGLAKPWCTTNEDLNKMVFPVLLSHDCDTRRDDETHSKFVDRMRDVLRSTAHHAAVDTKEELAAAYQRGGMASTGQRLELIFIHSRALLTWAAAGTSSWDVGGALPAVWTPAGHEVAAAKEGETSELVAAGDGRTFCRTVWGFVNRLRGTTGRMCKVLLLRAVAEWSEQRRAPGEAAPGLAGRSVSTHPIARERLWRAAANAAASGVGGAGGGSSGSGGGSVSSRASDAAAEEDIDVFDEIADAAVDSIDSEAADADFEDESEEKVGERFGKLGISSRNGPEAHSRGSTIQQATQLLRSGDVVGALLSDERVEPVQSDSGRAQLADAICAQVCHLSGEMRTALRGRLLERELVCVSLEAPRTGGSGRGRGSGGVPVEPQNWTPPTTNEQWFTREVYSAMLSHKGDLLVARTAAQAGTQDGVWIDLLMLLRALFVEHCALNGVFWDRAADGSLQEAVGVRTVINHEHCAQGKLPWMQVLIPSNRTRRRPIQACKVVVASAVLGGLTAAKPVATGAQYLVTRTLDIMPAGGVAGSRAKAKAPASTTGQKRKARSSDAGMDVCAAAKRPAHP